MSGYRLLVGDCREMLRTLPDESVHCVVTSPPYWGLRDYGVPPTVWGGDQDCDHDWGPQKKGRRKDILPAEESSAGRIGTHDRATGLSDGGRFCVRCGAWLGQLGLEPTPELYVEHMVEVFREVRRVLRPEGTLWLNLGDTFAASTRTTGRNEQGGRHSGGGGPFNGGARTVVGGIPQGLKPKDLIGIPWLVAFALRDDGWYLRSDIIWAKPNPMPESVRDRPTRAHEYIFLLTKSDRYWYDADAVKEPTLSLDPGHPSYRPNSARIAVEGRKEYHAKHEMSARSYNPAGRNARSVWTITTKPYSGAHFATFPPELAEKCILAGCPKGGTVLDPFAGSGTTGMVATGQGRNAILIELNPRYAELIRDRIGPMLEEEVAHVA